MFSRKLLAGALLSLGVSMSATAAETIRIAIGTQDSTINCATGGLLIRELNLLDKYLPRDGKYKDAKYDIQWKNFTSGPPLTNEMVAEKLDIGSMADFPGSLNAATFKQAGGKSFFITALSGSTSGSGNGIVVPAESSLQTLVDLKGKQVSVPFGSTAHGMLLRALSNAGIDPDKDLTLVSQAPEVGGTSLQTNKIDAHADFVPFAELFPFRGFARKIYDGAEAKTPTFHGSLVNAVFAEKYPELVVAFLKASIEADRLIAEEPEKYSELISKVTGIEAEVNYLFHGPLGIQTRDQTWKPEYKAALSTAVSTLKLLKRTEVDLSVDELVNDRFIRQAFAESGKNYDAQLQNYAKLPLNASDASSGAAISDAKSAAQIWINGEPKVRHYATPQSAFAALKTFESSGKKARVVYVHDQNTGLKLFAKQAWFAQDGKGNVSAFLQKAAAEQWAGEHQGKTLSFAEVKALSVNLAAN